MLASATQTYGVLTFGRQTSLVYEGTGAYDPMAHSYAFSILGYSGTVGAGLGSGEATRWDNSVKYIYTYDAFHIAGMFTSGGQETPMVGTGYAGNLGVTWKGFSLDGFYTKENGLVSLALIPNPAYGGAITCVSGALPSSGQYCPQYLLGTVQNSSGWDIMAKYIYEFGGGFKDESPAAKLTFFAGYQHVDLSNPSSSEIRLQRIYSDWRLSLPDVRREGLRIGPYSGNASGRAPISRAALGSSPALTIISIRTPTSTPRFAVARSTTHILQSPRTESANRSPATAPAITTKAPSWSITSSTNTSTSMRASATPR